MGECREGGYALPRHNFPLLGLPQVTVHCADGVEYLQQMEPVDCLFLDPARLDSQGGKPVAMADREPDVQKLEPLLVEKGRTVVVKLSPMLDIFSSLRELKYIRQIHVVAVNNECKELLVVLQKEIKSPSEGSGEVWISCEQAVNNLLEAELTAFLGYDPYARNGWNTGNSRNGAYFRKVDTQFGPIKVQVPRDRNGQFHQHTLPDYKQHSDILESMIIKLYSKGVTTREIADLIEKMYGSHYSPTQVSNISKQMIPKVEAYHKRKLSDKLFCVYLDATYLPLRRETFEREAVYIAIGIKPNGQVRYSKGTKKINLHDECKIGIYQAQYGAFYTLSQYMGHNRLDVLQSYLGIGR